MSKYLLNNGRVILPNKLLTEGGIVVDEQKIVEIYSGNIENSEFFQKENSLNYKVIDVDGRYLSPGFIDIHVHGGANADFMDGDQDGIKDIVKLHGDHGTTSLVATTLTSSHEDLLKALDSLRNAAAENYRGARILGVHLEGPYFAPEQAGAQNPEFLKEPNREEYMGLIEKYPDLITRLSAAPELDGSLEMAEELTAADILVSLAHTDASYNQVLEAAAHGFSHVTHIYNSIASVKSPDFYCQAGAVEAGLVLDEMTAEVIADGRHIPEGILKLLYKTKGADKLALITDATRAAGMPPGEYQLGGLDIIVEDKVGMLADRSSFAGSVATTDRLVRVMYREVGLSLIDVIKMMTLTPARIIGEDRQKGSLTCGKDADIVVFDEDINISFVMREGDIIKNKLAQ